MTLLPQTSDYHVTSLPQTDLALDGVEKTLNSTQLQLDRLQARLVRLDLQVQQNLINLAAARNATEAAENTSTAAEQVSIRNLPYFSYIVINTCSHIHVRIICT